MNLFVWSGLYSDKIWISPSIGTGQNLLMIRHSITFLPTIRSTSRRWGMNIYSRIRFYGNVWVMHSIFRVRIPPLASIQPVLSVYMAQLF